MKHPIHITPHFAVTGALQREDFARAAALGFKSIISNLPDGELSAHPTSGEATELAARAGLGFRHVPVIKHDLFSTRVVAGTQVALAELPGPILAHCASGLRSAAAWAAAATLSQPADCILAHLAAVGIDLRALREDLLHLHPADGARPIPAPLDAGCV
jgi:uncharacterized protein (TIGR01244 family)